MVEAMTRTEFTLASVTQLDELVKKHQKLFLKV